MVRQQKRAVIVEDSEAWRKLLHLALGNVGIIDIAEARNGLDALEVLKANQADIVIMDWQMDGMDGMECTKRIRAGIEGVDPAIPIILLTGMANEQSKAAAYEAGATLFMAKPFSLRQLNAGVLKVLQPT